MIDWLERLWKAAEEGSEFDLLVEPDLFSVSNRGMSWAGKDNDAAEGELWTQVPERTGSLEQPEVERVGSARSALRMGKRSENASGVQRLYRGVAGSALAELYHRVRETVSPVQPAVPGHGNTVVVREEVAAVPGLTEEKLDRSLRRDGRRYDGGMSIY